jgi:hypothetical protein
MGNALSQVLKVAVAAIAFTAGLAGAQGEMKGPPGPGLLEGQAPPQGPLQRRRGPPIAAPGPLQSLTVRNSAATPVWATLVRDQIVDRGSCLQPGEERIWALPGGADRVAWRIRGQVTRDAQCRAPVDCDASIDRRPGMVSLELRARGRECAWSVAGVKSQGLAPAPSAQGARQILAQVENKSAAYVWVMLLTPPRRGTMELLDTMCMEPHQVSGFGVHEGRSYVMMASVRTGESCMMEAGCEAKAQYVGSRQPVRFEANERSCRWVQ